MIYNKEDTHSDFPFETPGVLKLAHDCRHIDGLIEDEKPWAIAAIRQADELRKIAETFGVDLYYTSEYTNLYDEDDIREAFNNDKMLKITSDQIELWKSKVRS